MPELTIAPPLNPVDYQPDARGPLEGVRVLDLGRLAAGGHCGLVLADLGADVVKVEKPKVGDEMRGMGRAALSPYWVVYNRNKRSLALDLKSDAGRELLLEILPQFDVLAENFRPGTLESLGLGPDALLARHPGLVITRLSGWGQTGPYANRPGFGTLAEAVSGYMLRNGYADRPPVPAPTALADMVAGLYGACATIAAVLHVRDGGPGQVVDVSLFEPMTSIMGPDALLDQLGRLPVRGEGTRASSVKGIFECSDGLWIALSAGTDSIVQRVFEALGMGDFAADSRFATYDDRLENREEINAIIGAWVAQRSREEALAHFHSHGVTAGPLYAVADARRDPHFRARNVFVDLPGRPGEPERIAMHNIVPHLSVTPSGIRRPAPLLGEDTTDVLREAGIAPERITALLADEIIEENHE
ncbi:CoA transferase [Nocardioides carbamazepini]|uniref:CaiB/BaiF CoA transferase family protein n=1 Tax=Nocardioides carbamazepini TaxID=2854259 RepID=UPI00214A3812|nr:CoA transferase [Nocardioides carbamazepini]MCR1785835.1 CoA transferase [Nocardioides carbamazepini]